MIKLGTVWVQHKLLLLLANLGHVSPLIPAPSGVSPSAKHGQRPKHPGGERGERSQLGRHDTFLPPSINPLKDVQVFRTADRVEELD